MTAIGRDALRELRTLALSKDLRCAVELNRWMHEASVYVIGRLLGFGEAQLPKLANWMEQFVACLSPLSSEQQIEAAGRAASDLMDEFRGLLESGNTDNGLIERIKSEAKFVEWNNVVSLVSNLIGLFSQAYEGTAGLIGNTIIALVRQPGLQPSLRLAPEGIQPAVEEVGRFDPSVQNTRRFVTTKTHIGSVELNQGDVILLLLAAANRDPLLNEHPNQFLVDRPTRRTLGFGHGVHSCPGQELANVIAASATKIVLEQLSPTDFGALAWGYRPSVNGRIPVFYDPTTPGE
jgi:cytochrome P450